MHKDIIGIKYCGGCNPRYDRVELVNNIKNSFKEYYFSEVKDNCSAVILICGCNARCIDINKIGNNIHLFFVTENFNIKNLKDFLLNLKLELSN